MLEQMIRNGMNVARINFAHGDRATHALSIAILRQIAEEEDRLVAVMGDLCGPKIRTGQIAPDTILVEEQVLRVHVPVKERCRLRKPVRRDRLCVAPHPLKVSSQTAEHLPVPASEQIPALLHVCVDR